MRLADALVQSCEAGEGTTLGALRTCLSLPVMWVMKRLKPAARFC